MNAIFTGRRRSGKTTLAFHMARMRGGAILVFDPKREFRGWPGTVSSVAGIERCAKKKIPIIVFHPDGDTDAAFTGVGDWVVRQHEIAMAKGWDKIGLHFTFLVDEAHNVQGPQWANPKLLQILSQNRPEILDAYQTFQSPKDAYNRIKSRVSDWFIFSTNLPSDLEYLRREIGVSEDDVARITTMGDHEYAHFYFDGGSPVAEFVTDSDTWYTDLNFNKETEAQKMAVERDTRDERDEFPESGIRIMDRAGLDEAHSKYNRRKADDPKSKYRQRKGDNQREANGSGNGGGRSGNEIVFGRKKAS